MRLRELFDGLEQGPDDPEITSMALDDRLVSDGTLFCCVPGFERDGHDFAAGAVESGAVALLAERPLGLGVAEVIVDDVRAAIAPAAARLSGEPTRSLEMVGITGTNGKTTTAFLTRAVLEASGRQTGLLGTVEQVIGGRREAAVRTTPEAIELQRCFAEMVTAGDRACVMEVSSHAIALRRSDAIDWDVTVFTNLSQEHLDFHRDLEEYFNVKARLLRESGCPSVVNIDDQHGRQLAETLTTVTTVGIASDDADLRAESITTDATGSNFNVGGVEFRVPLPGDFNVVNALCAIAVARILGVEDAAIALALSSAEVAPGRFQPVDAGQAFSAIVDYAHTPDSLENALRTARALTDGRLIVVFGAGGDRDSGKRPQMGRVASELADLMIVTSDNPRSEDPAAIIEAILAGVSEGGAAAVEVVADRGEAIKMGVALAAEGDVVMVAGKGHEQGQEIANGVVLEFDDSRVLRTAIEGLRS
jgi:UDP-N-acetylmuramoyl-L-alanyl-D-glutamate--2,6-diaminopimelate ligase